jgi:hypothetical protein
MRKFSTGASYSVLPRRSSRPREAEVMIPLLVESAARSIVHGLIGELIFYRRTDEHGPNESYYVRSPTAAPDTLRKTLALAYGEVGRVRKRRTLFLVGRTRIHLDIVEGLGHFLELEVVLRDGESTQAGVREAEELMQRLNVEPSQLIDRAYVDLLAEQSGRK